MHGHACAWLCALAVTLAVADAPLCACLQRGAPPLWGGEAATGAMHDARRL